jgi:hypothetical protein
MGKSVASEQFEHLELGRLNQRRERLRSSESISFRPMALCEPSCLGRSGRRAIRNYADFFC